MKKQIGNIVDVQTGIILHQVNCQGVMGSGVAAALRAVWPIVFSDYKDFVSKNTSREVWADGRNLLGEIVVSQVTPTLKVISLFGQQYYGRDGKKYTSYDALDTALSKVAKLQTYEIGNPEHEIHHPLIGSALGGGHWPIVAEIIKFRLGETTLWTLS